MSEQYPSSTFSPLAIVGAWCRLPGAANPEAFWELIINGWDATGELPNEILDRDLYYSPGKSKVGRSYTSVGGLMPTLPFDNSKCRLSEEAIQKYDASHLVACEVASEALRDAGYDPFGISGQDVGVYLGHTGGSSKIGDVMLGVQIEETTRYLSELPSLSGVSRDRIDTMARRITDRIRARNDHRRQNADLELESHTAAKLIASAFDLRGPTVVVDAACASSLQALALAARALHQGTIDMAVVGGASCCKGDSLILFSAAQSVAEGKSCPFDTDASGLVAAEGNVTLIVKRFEDAVASGDRIQGVIRSLGVSADGKGKSLWAPLKHGQQLAVQRAYSSSNPQEQIQYIEAHATSTQVGDATELQALSESFPELEKQIPLGSVKANIGHTLETAGLAGVMKILLALRHQTFPPCANLQTPNPDICWDKFRLPKTPEPWPAPSPTSPRKAAVNAFGIGGLNVHVVMEESPLASESAGESAGVSTGESAGVSTGTHSGKASVKSITSGRADSPEPIAVIGMGCVLPGANSVDEFWNLLESGDDPKSFVTAERWNPGFVDPENGESLYRTPSGIGGFCTDYVYDWRKHRVPPKQIAAANPLQFMLLDAADQALRDARYMDGISEEVRDRTGVIVGTSFGGDFSNQLQMGLRLPEVIRELHQELAAIGIIGDEAGKIVQSYEDELLQRMPALVDETGSFTSSTLASRITKTFNLKGGALAMDAGDSTGLVTLSTSIDVLRSGDCDVMLCAAGQRCMDLPAFNRLSANGFLAKASPEPAFGQSCDGIVPGEGTCVLVLKRLSDAVRDGDDVRAVIRDVSVVTETHNPSAALQHSAETAMRRSGTSPEDIVLVESRGGIPEIEKTEIWSLNEAFAANRNKRLPVTSTVAQFGYLGGAHSLLSVMRAALSIERGYASPSFPPQVPRTDLFSNVQLEPQKSKVDINADNSDSVVAVAFSGHSGTGCTAILEPLGRLIRMKAITPANESSVASASLPLKGDPKILRVGAADWAELKSRIEQVECTVLWQSESRFRPADRLRVALVARNREELQQQIEQLRGLSGPADYQQREMLANKGVFVGDYRGARNCAFSFPGHGSQYPGMLSDLFREDPAAWDAMQQADAALALLGKPRFESMAGAESDTLHENPWNTQSSILIASWVTDCALRHAGLEPTVVFGHSFGEYAAIISAGGWSITDALRGALLRSESLAAIRKIDGCMLATTASMDALQRLVPELGDGIYVANVNGPSQIVLSGYRALVETVGRRLSQHRFASIPLAVSFPFHSPLMQPAAELFAVGVRQIPLRKPNVPIISTISLGPMIEASTVIDSLNRQFVTSVNYSEMLEKVLKARPALVIEVGPKQVLTQLSERMPLDSDAYWMATDRKGRPGRLAILDIVAQAECLGCMDTKNQSVPLPSEPVVTNRRGRIATFDATQSRRERMRRQSQKRESRNATGNGNAASSDATGELREIQNRNGRNGSASSTSHDAFAESHDAAGALHSEGNAWFGSGTSTRSGSALEPSLSFVTSQIDSTFAGHQPDSGNQANIEIANAKPTSNGLTSESIIEKSELRLILVEFVVEQTGYPEEMVELDADLESELGIDSIKKAQLFGELAGRFDIAPRDGMTLDDFATLTQILEFLMSEIGSPAAANAEPVAMETATTQPVHMTPSAEVIRNVATVTSHDPRSAGDAGLVGHRDDQPDTSQTGSCQVEISREELRLILVEFVVEQTGYPEEMVELDADLESELGIDSIKKAQLFGELAGRFDIAPRDGMTLDDFATLAQILEFLMSEIGSPAAANAEPVAVSVNPSAFSNEEVKQTTTDVVSKSGSGIYVSEAFQADPRQRGLAIGKACSMGIQKQLAAFVDTIQPAVDFEAGPGLSGELGGIAEGANVNRSVVGALSTTWIGCGQLCVGQECDGPSIERSPLAITMRSGAGRYRYLTGSACGQIFVPMGLNAAGLAISTCPTVSKPTRSEMENLSQVLHHVLNECESVEQAFQMLTGLKLSSPWQLLLSDSNTDAPIPVLVERGQDVKQIETAPAALSWWHDAIDWETGQLVLFPSDAERPFSLDLVAHLGEITDQHSPVSRENPLLFGVEKVNASNAARLKDDALMRRHLLRMVPQSISSGNTALPETMLVIGDSPDLTLLTKQLEESGIRVTSATLERAAAGGYFEELSERPECILLASPLEKPPLLPMAAISMEPFAAALEVCRQFALRFEKDGKSTPAAIVTLSRMNGDFGFGAGTNRFMGGGFTGLLKAVRREYPEFLIKALDVSEAVDTRTICAALLAELTSGNTELEVGFAGSQRMVVSAEAVPATAPVEVSEGGVWIVTGGGRGVTNVVAHELAKRFGLRLHLIGTASLAGQDAAWRGLDKKGLKELKKQVAIEARRAGKLPASEWARIEKQQELEANLQALAKDGIDATYHICDISDCSDLAVTLDRIRSQEGAINGVIHGAGVESASRLTRKKPELVRRTISSKCQGAANLMNLTTTDRLEHFVAFGSTSGRFGGLGQADYSLASDLLAKMVGALALERPQTRCVCIHWPAWDDVGMAVRPESRMALERGGLKFMPSLEGVEHLIGELTGSSSDHEVLILDGPSMLDTDGTLTRPSSAEPIMGVTSTANPLSVQQAEIKSESVTCDRQLVDQIRQLDSNKFEAVVWLDPTRDVFLKEHLMRGKPFLPAVMTMELFAQAVQQIRPESDVVEMSQVSVVNGLRLTEATPYKGKIRIEQIGDVFRCELLGPRPNQDVGSHQFVYSSAVLRCGNLALAEPIDVGEPVFGWTPFIYPADAAIFHGPAFHTLAKLDFQHGGGRGKVLGFGKQDLLAGLEGTAIVPAAALDGCFLLCGIFGYAMLEKAETLPYGIGSYRQYGRPRAGEMCTARIYYRETNEIGPVFDFTLVSDSNKVILTVEGYQTARIRATQ